MSYLRVVAVIAVIAVALCEAKPSGSRSAVALSKAAARLAAARGGERVAWAQRDEHDEAAVAQFVQLVQEGLAQLGDTAQLGVADLQAAQMDAFIVMMGQQAAAGLQLWTPCSEGEVQTAPLVWSTTAWGLLLGHGVTGFLPTVLYNQLVAAAGPEVIGAMDEADWEPFGHVLDTLESTIQAEFGETLSCIYQMEGFEAAKDQSLLALLEQAVGAYQANIAVEDASYAVIGHLVEVLTKLPVDTCIAVDSAAVQAMQECLALASPALANPAPFLAALEPAITAIPPQPLKPLAMDMLKAVFPLYTDALGSALGHLLVAVNNGDAATVLATPMHIFGDFFAYLYTMEQEPQQLLLPGYQLPLQAVTLNQLVEALAGEVAGPVGNKLKQAHDKLKQLQNKLLQKLLSVLGEKLAEKFSADELLLLQQELIQELVHQMTEPGMIVEEEPTLDALIQD